MIGKIVRELRERRGLTVQQLADITGFSKGLISQIETGKVSPTTPTLEKIVKALGLGLAEFFYLVEKGTDGLYAIKRASENPTTQSTAIDPLAETFSGREMEPIVTKLAPGSSLPAHSHFSDEFWYIISGQIEAHIGERREILRTGDSIYFNGVFSHSCINLSIEPSTILMITSKSKKSGE